MATITKGAGAQVGIWLNSREAVIVRLEEEGEAAGGRRRGARAKPEVLHVLSEVEGWGKRTGGRHGRMPYQQASAMAPLENRLKQRREHEMKAFFKQILKTISGAGQVVIFGPGVVKSQLEHAAARSKVWRDRIVAIEPADQMTEGEVVAETLRVFRRMPPRLSPGQTPRGRLSRRNAGSSGALAVKERESAKAPKKTPARGGRF